MKNSYELIRRFQDYNPSLITGYLNVFVGRLGEAKDAQIHLDGILSRVLSRVYPGGNRLVRFNVHR